MAFHIMDTKFAVVQVGEFVLQPVVHCSSRSVLCYPLFMSSVADLKAKSVDATAIHVCGTKPDCSALPVVRLCATLRSPCGRKSHSGANP